MITTDATPERVGAHLLWADVERLSESLASAVTREEWRPDVIVAVARGGLVPAQLLAHHLDVREVTAVGARFADVERTEMRLYAMPMWPLGAPQRVLTVEDAVDTGRLLLASTAVLPGEIRTAALLATGVWRPNYVGATVAAIPAMPWER